MNVSLVVINLELHVAFPISKDVWRVGPCILHNLLHHVHGNVNGLVPKGCAMFYKIARQYLSRFIRFKITLPCIR